MTDTTTTTTSTTSSLADKIAKLQAAMDAAKADLEQKERELKDSQERLDVAKIVLQTMDAEDQAKIQISDTKYPDLLAMHQLAQDAYETAHKRYQTNQTYLDKFTTAAAATTKSS